MSTCTHAYTYIFTYTYVFFVIWVNFFLTFLDFCTSHFVQCKKEKLLDSYYDGPRNNSMQFSMVFSNSPLKDNADNYLGLGLYHKSFQVNKISAYSFFFSFNYLAKIPFLVKSTHMYHRDYL